VPNTHQLAKSQTPSETSIHSRAQLLGSEAKISFPEKLVVTPSGQTYFRDTDLSTIFAVHNKDRRISRVCGSEVFDCFYTGSCAMEMQ
jgi:hypothetical protein